MLPEPIGVVAGQVVCPLRPRLGVTPDQAALAAATRERRELRDGRARVWARMP